MKKEILERIETLKKSIAELSGLVEAHPHLQPLKDSLEAEKAKLLTEERKLELILKGEKANKTLAKIAAKLPSEFTEAVTKWLEENQETSKGVRIVFEANEEGEVKPFVTRVERSTKKERSPRPENAVPGGARGAQCRVEVNAKTYEGLGAEVARMISDENNLGWDFEKSVNWHKVLESYCKRNGGTYSRI